MSDTRRDTETRTAATHVAERLCAAMAARLAAFRDDSRGTVSVEAVIMLPILFWAYMAMFVYFDAYRQTSISQKAAFTISDMISRETQPINAAYIDATQELFDFLIPSRASSRIRITIARYDAEADSYDVVWSQVRGTVAEMTKGNLQRLRGSLPEVPDGEQFILVESWTPYEAPFSIGLDDEVIGTLVTARPRFAPQVKWVDAIS